MSYRIPVFLAAFVLVSLQMHGQKPVYLDPRQSISKRLDDLLKRMTLEEKLAQMCQYVGIEHQVQSYRINKGREPDANDDASTFYKGISFDSLKAMVINGRVGSFLHIVTARESNEMQRLAMQSRLRVPVLIGIDAIHGNAMVSGCTVFPTPLGLAGTFNTDLVKEISAATAREMRATGSHWTFTPNVDIARDARWGRVGETFGEDTYLVSEMGVAMVRGLQGAGLEGMESVASCLKHLIGGGQSVNGLNGAPTDISERTLWEFHLPPYRAGIEAGAFTVMAAHNELNGVPCHANGYLMNDIIRANWQFKGFFVSDWMDIERLNTVHHVAASQKEAVYQAVMAGMDMHMHGPGFLEPLVELVREKRVPMSYIDRAASKILELKFRLGLFEQPYVDEKKVATSVFTSEHKQLALQAARESIVLLKNTDNVLPINSNARRILVTGPNADNQTILGDWALPQPGPNVITVYQGIREQAPAGTAVDLLVTGTVKKISDSVITAASEKAKNYDAIVVAVGENSLRYQNAEKTSGENVDRDNIGLIGQQNKLISALAGSGKTVIVVLVNSRPLAVGEITKNIPAVIEAWEPGSFGGQALGEIIFGKLSPSGKLPISIPRSTGQIPTYYNYKPSNYFHKYIETQSSALYDFGFGLSYTSFTVTDAGISSEILPKSGHVTLSCKLTNTGNMDGDEVVQVYIRDEVASTTRPVKELKHFQRVSLKKGESKRLEWKITEKDLQMLNVKFQPVVEPGSFLLMVGTSSNDKDLQKIRITYE